MRLLFNRRKIPWIGSCRWQLPELCTYEKQRSKRKAITRDVVALT